MQIHANTELKDSGFCGNYGKENLRVSPEFLAGSVEFPPLPVHLDTSAAEYISVVFFLSCVSRIIPFKGVVWRQFTKCQGSIGTLASSSKTGTSKMYYYETSYKLAYQYIISWLNYDKAQEPNNLSQNKALKVLYCLNCLKTICENYAY